MNVDLVLSGVLLGGYGVAEALGQAGRYDVSVGGFQLLEYVSTS